MQKITNKKSITINHPSSLISKHTTMNHLIKTTLSLATIMFLASCGNNQQEVSEHAHHQHESAEQEQAAGNMPVAIQDDQLNAVYPHYVHLTEALVTENINKAKTAANAIEAGAAASPNGKNLALLAAKITALSDIEEQRTVYAELSEEMIGLVKTAGMQQGELYLTHCPMAFDDKGASWLSKSKTVRNPYYGDKMLSCGAVKETLQ